MQALCFKECIWMCSLQNVGHFVLASICQSKVTDEMILTNFVSYYQQNNLIYDFHLYKNIDWACHIYLYVS